MRSPNAIVCLALALCASAAPIQAAEFLVTQAADSGAGSLRAAVEAANLQPGPHEIRFAEGFPQGGMVMLQGPLPAVTQSLQIRGNGRAPVISGGGIHSIFRVANGRDLALFDLELRDGRVQDLVGSGFVGGACIEQGFNTGTSALHLERVRVSGCVARGAEVEGGAILWRARNGEVRIIESDILDNLAEALAPEGIYNGGALATSSALSIIDSTFERNEARAQPGGGGFGGAVQAGVAGDQQILIRGSRFRDNAAASDGGYGFGGAVSLFCSSDNCSARIESSYFRDNEAIDGGAIYIGSSNGVSPRHSLENLTLLSNRAQLSGGAVLVQRGALSLNHITSIGGSAGQGGHLALEFVQLDSLLNSVFGDTQGGPCALEGLQGAGPRLVGNVFTQECRPLSDTGAQLVPSLGLIGLSEVQRVGVLIFDPGAAPIDGGSQDAADCAAVDARGNSRPKDGDGDGEAVCDAGSYEHPAVPLVRIFRNGFEAAADGFDWHVD